MKRLVFLSGWALLLLGCPRQPYSMRIVDASNEPLPTIEVDDQEIVLGRVGQTYRIEIENSTNKAVGFMISVDGLDTHSGRKAPLDERGGYHLAKNAWGTIDGFELSDTQISSFRFVDEKDAFAKLQDTSADMGRIEARFFAIRCGSSTNIPFQYTRPPTAESSSAGNSSNNDPGPLTGELMTTAGRGIAPCILDLGAEVGRQVVMYRNRRGKRIGTAGPPPVSPAPTDPLPIHDPPPKSPSKKTTPKVIDKKKG